MVGSSKFADQLPRMVIGQVSLFSRECSIGDFGHEILREYIKDHCRPIVAQPAQQLRGSNLGFNRVSACEQIESAEQFPTVGVTAQRTCND